MSLKDRVVDGVSSLLETLHEGEGLSGVKAEELEVELARRAALRKAAGSPSPSDNARARLAEAGAKARKQRADLAAARIKKIHGQRAKDAARKQSADDAAFREMAEEARRNPPRPSSRSSQVPPRSSQRPPRSSGRRSSGRRSSGSGNDIMQHYKTLGVDYGADAVVVKKAYRSLMRKYHPDLHKDPKKKKAATTLTVKISAAYAAIEEHNKS